MNPPTDRNNPPQPSPVDLEKASAGVRLQLVIARAGVASRREAERLIESGAVTVNGQVVKELGTKVQPNADHVKVHGRALPKPRGPEYFLFHKPTGVVTTMSDPEKRLCIGDFVGDHSGRLFPVGRLDFMSSGLLLLTSDGHLAERLMHPKYKVEKTYLVKADKPLDRDSVDLLRDGVLLDDGPTAPAYVAPQRRAPGKGWWEVRIHEGRNRQVRRMFEAVGVVATKLKRSRIGPLLLGDLREGQMRRLTEVELAELRVAVGMISPEKAFESERTPRGRRARPGLGRAERSSTGPRESRRPRNGKPDPRKKRTGPRAASKPGSTTRPKAGPKPGSKARAKPSLSTTPASQRPKRPDGKVAAKTRSTGGARSRSTPRVSAGTKRPSRPGASRSKARSRRS